MPNSLGLRTFSGTFSIDPGVTLTGAGKQATELELNSVNISMYLNDGSLAGTAQSGQIFIDPVKSWFGLVFQVETTIGMGIAGVRLLFEYSKNSTSVSLPITSEEALRDGYFSATWSPCLRSQVTIPVGNATITTQNS